MLRSLEVKLNNIPVGQVTTVFFNFPFHYTSLLKKISNYFLSKSVKKIRKSFPRMASKTLESKKYYKRSLSD